MADDTPVWQPKMCEAVGTELRTHLYLPDGNSLCMLAKFKDARKVADGEEVTACGPCLVAAGLLSNMATEMLLGTAAPRQSIHESAKSLAAGPLSEVTSDGAIERWVLRGKGLWGYVTMGRI